jgi:hypothetical protein
MDANLVAGIAHEHGIRLLLQFGSTVTGRTHARSDVDEIDPVRLHDACRTAVADLPQYLRHVHAWLADRDA